VEELPSLSRRTALVALAAVLALLVLAGRWVGRPGADGTASPTPSAAPALSARPAPAKLVVVHVVGAVRRAGLYELRDGSRVADAVARAGGATKGADLALINLAAPVADGAQVLVPRRSGPGVPGAPAPPGGVPAGPVSLNSATLEQLDALPGVGPSTAQKILDYRTRHGAFRAVEELDAIPGIGPARLEQLRELVVP
jgi:competence protein ComEA